MKIVHLMFVLHGNMEIVRQISKEFKEYTTIFPATGVLGPRQVGKTTLAKQMATDQDFLYLDLERQADRDRLQHDPAYFLGQFSGRCVILDEVQFMPELFSELRGIIDANRRPGRFVLLGSASPDIVRGSAETLAGRIGCLQLTPFTVLEVEDLKRLWHRGGFPLSYLADSERTSKVWRKSFITTYIQRDLGLLGLQTEVQVMDRFWRILATAHGNLLNAESLGRALDLSRTTIMRYVDFLEGAFMLRRLPPWFRNINKRLVKSPKIYLRDSGLLHSLLNINTYEALINHISVGASWEGFVIEQIINCAEEDINAWFYRTQQGAECDLILERSDKVLAAVEIKLGSSPKISKGFRISMEDTGAQHGYLVGTGKETYKVEENITITNLDFFLKEILPNI